jgi:NADH:ubiquinone oxidoreductase subunit
MQDAVYEGEEEATAIPGRWHTWVSVADVYKTFLTYF